MRNISTPRPSDIDYPRVWLLAATHLTNDMYGSIVSGLMPYLVLDGQIGSAAAGLVVLVYLAGSSVLQPLFGLISDGTGRRYFVVVGPLSIGIVASFLGWIHGPLALLCLAGVAGVGTAAFHPQAASMVDNISPRAKGSTMAIFSMGGNIGFALGPLVAAGIATLGLHWSAIILPPGLALSLLLALYAPKLDGQSSRAAAHGLRSALGSWRPLSLVVSVIALRSGAQYGLILFLPLYFHARGLPPVLGSYSAFVLSLSGAFGGLLGGRLSDMYGRKPVVAGSLLATTPLLFLALVLTGPLVWPLLVLSGACLLASNSVTVVQGQELLPDATGVASGLTMGLGFGLSGVIAAALGGLSGQIGVTAAVLLIPVVPLLAALVAAGTPSQTQNCQNSVPSRSSRSVAVE